MSQPVEIRFSADAPDLTTVPGRIAILVDENGRVPGGLPSTVRSIIRRAIDSDQWGKVAPGGAMDLAFPARLTADALQLVSLPVRADVITARKAGAAIGRAMGKGTVTVLTGRHAKTAEVALGLALRGYDFGAYKSKGGADAGADDAIEPARAPQSVSATGAAPDAVLIDASTPSQADTHANGGAESTPQPDRATVTVICADPEAVARAARPGAAVAEGVFFTRDLVNEPANVLTTTDFADRLSAMSALGLDVEVIDEDELSRLGMRALLAVGQGSESPSKVVIMRWNGGGDEPPLALVGKGVVFDTGGISIKPAAGMEEMTMDMGGAGVVAGVMRTLALRGAKANVVGLVGLVENMPDGKAQRPGDIVRSMKGETIEVINTDAEGRLVLADVLWLAQERYNPSAIIDLATLTGAVIIALGHENAGVFSNNDAFAQKLLGAAGAEGEGAWRLPLAPAYDDLIKAQFADIKNTGGRPAGSITAAQFLQHFVKPDVPWAHIDIAGVALPPGGTALAPKGASGWGVMTLDRLVRDHFETK
ncbi:MAG: leucyl aminopeptidase [Paracoccus denitrificans]|nr:MAG: leucyl aminopeptidase [Paracoccus denitrificans]PZO85181.1 MAG: leucyl aminopeptidase [Paracoccus denitrificans]